MKWLYLYRTWITLISLPRRSFVKMIKYHYIRGPTCSHVHLFYNDFFVHNMYEFNRKSCKNNIAG